MFKKILFLFSIFFISGCVQSNKNTVMYHSFPDLEKKKKVKKVDNLPDRVAILTFYSKNYEASKIVTNAFYNFFSILPYEDVEISEIYDIFSKQSSEAVILLLAACWNKRMKEYVELYLKKYCASAKIELSGDDLIGTGMEPGSGFNDVFKALRDARINGQVTSRDEEIVLDDSDYVDTEYINNK